MLQLVLMSISFIPGRTLPLDSATPDHLELLRKFMNDFNYTKPIILVDLRNLSSLTTMGERELASILSYLGECTLVIAHTSGSAKFVSSKALQRTRDSINMSFISVLFQPFSDQEVKIYK